VAASAFGFLVFNHAFDGAGLYGASRMSRRKNFVFQGGGAKA
jgi:hypothetical protein